MTNEKAKDLEGFEIDSPMVDIQGQKSPGVGATLITKENEVVGTYGAIKNTQIFNTYLFTSNENRFNYEFYQLTDNQNAEKIASPTCTTTSDNQLAVTFLQHPSPPRTGHIFDLKTMGPVL